MRLQSFAQIAAALVMSAVLQATPIGTPTLSVTGPGEAENSSLVVHLTFDGDLVSGSGQGPGFFWSISGDSDPLINWGLIAIVPGPYHMEFFLPVAPGFYEVLRNQASVTLSDVGLGTAGTSVSSIVINGQVPDLFSILDVQLTSGPITALNGGTGGAFLGPLLSIQSFMNPFGMQIVVDFVLSSPDNDGSAAFTGQLLLTNLPIDGDSGEAPEPATTALIAVGLLGIAGLRKYLRS